ncbi:TetR/AcrR family transcriptional regulator [Mycobacterium sp. pUA109]|uniref:TetR/AcrR family transcriptional regulator n=1 Tax=Mycobacterium sp. pUA109 TaxID=3238982 RepID=UPI00351B1DB8
MPEAVHTSTRKDAARNRARLLEAAAVLFASESLIEVTLKDVARQAGVGVGTVYRHFPTKEDLVEALFAEHLDREVQRARTMAQEPDGWDGLVRYLEDTMTVQAANRGLRALMCPAGSVHDTVRECKTMINPYVEQMIDTAHRQGTLRKDCTARDIAHLQVALVGIMDASPGSPEQYRRHLKFFLDGVRAH